MPEKFKASLNGLGDEIKTVKKDGPEEPKLQKIQNWVDEYLADEQPLENKEHHSFVEDLQDAAEHYEVSHPKLTELINQVLNTLSNMGI